MVTEKLRNFKDLGTLQIFWDLTGKVKGLDLSKRGPDVRNPNNAAGVMVF
jgi:hypothetical protein